MESPIILFADAVQRLSSGVLAGERILFAGRLGGMNRKEAKSIVQDNGGTVSSKSDRDITLVVIGADHLDMDADDNDLLPEWLDDAHRSGLVKLIDETQLWQRLGLVEEDSGSSQLYTPAMLAKLLNVPIASIRRWHRRGLIVPTHQVHKLPYFDFAEVASARRIAKLIASGASATAIESKLSRLAQLAPELERPLSQLSVIVDGRNVFFRQGEGLVEPSGQKRFDFDADDDTDNEESHLSIGPIADRSVDQLATPEEFIELAVDMEDDQHLESAVDVYHAMALACGPSPDVSFRIAELLYQMGDLTGARERYFAAVEQDPTFVEARASLGCVLVDLEQTDLAISAFRGALDHHPDYPDVHFHLAGLLNDLGNPKEARPHWERFLELAPKSPWAEEARQRLAELEQS